LTKQKKESIYLNRLLEGIKLDDKKRSDKEWHFFTIVPYNWRADKDFPREKHPWSSSPLDPPYKKW
jgi:hypothetical protein